LSDGPSPKSDLYRTNIKRREKVKEESEFKKRKRQNKWDPLICHFDLEEVRPSVDSLFA
jgi:hypothetical protein